MIRLTRYAYAVPGAFFNPLAENVESFSLVGMMFDEMQTRAASDDISQFLDNLSTEEQRNKYYEDHSMMRRWFEVAVAQRNTDMVSQLVKFVHETPAPPGWTQLYENVYLQNGDGKHDDLPKKHWGLTSYHYHCLLRVFSHQGDSQSLQQLVQIMQKRSTDERRKNTEAKADSQHENSETLVDEMYWRKRHVLTSTVNANTVAWLMWLNWNSGNIETVLRVFSDVAAPNDITNASRNLFLSPPDGHEDEWLNHPLPLQSAPLSMLLYICAQYCTPMSGVTCDSGRISETKTRQLFGVPSTANTQTSAPPELVVIIAATKELLQIPLTACDYLHLLLAVLNNHRIFQRILRNVLYNHRRSKELCSCPGHTSFNFLTELTQSVFAGPVRISHDDTKDFTANHMVVITLRALRSSFGVLRKDPAAIQRVSFVQTRHTTLNGWVRNVLDNVLKDCNDPASVFDGLLAWGEVHGRPSFTVNVSSYLYQRMQTPPASLRDHGIQSLASIRSRLCANHTISIIPHFTSISILADVIRKFPSGRVASVMLPKFVFFSSLCLNADIYKEDTRWYLRAQQMMFAPSAQELLTMVKELLNTKYADDRRISFGVIREGLRCCLDACVWLSPPNPKMQKNALMERFRWWIFNDARDISLTLYGSVPNINAKVKEVFARNASPIPSKSIDAMHAEFECISKIDKRCKRSHLDPDEHKRENPSWTNLPTAPVPPHCSDAEENNPYPHVFLGTTSAGETNTKAAHDPFDEVFDIIKNCNPQQSTWYLGDKDTVTRLLRCLLHRLEFQKAVDLMRSAIKVMGYGHKVDRDLQKFFTEIGDPSGSIAFKLAAGIMDGDVNPTKSRH